MAETMIDHRMDGLLLVTPTMPKAELRALREHPARRRRRARRTGATGFDTVATDDELGSALIVDHLVGLGHTAIAHITVESDDDDPTLPFRVRARGYEAAMRRHGLEASIDVRAHGLDHGRRDQRRGPVPAAPGTAHGHPRRAPTSRRSACSRRLWAEGIEIPRDVSVAGYDNSPIGMMAPISLTSVDQAAGELGTRAAALLLERIGGRTEPQSVLLQPTLVPRSTTAAPRS